MATRLYFHAASSPVADLPTAEQSTLTADKNAEGSQTTNRLMDTSIGSVQTDITTTVIADNNLHPFYFTRFVSPPIYQTSISANTWTYNFAAKEAGSQVTRNNFPVDGNNKPVWVNCYVWRPSSGTIVGKMLDGDTAATVDEQAAANFYSHHVTFSGSAVGSVQDGDVIIFEVWFRVTAANVSASNTNGFAFDGGTVQTGDNQVVTDHAAFIETPEDLVFTPQVLYASQMSIHKYDVRANTNQSNIQKYNVLENLNKTNIHKYNINQNVSQVNVQRYNLIEVPSETLLHTSLNQATTADTTQYWQVTGARMISTDKANVQIVFRTPGVIKNLMVRANGNTIPTGGMDFILHKNDSDTSLVVHIPPTTVGIFEDTDSAHAVSVSPGDKICIKSVPGAATGYVNVNHQGAIFRAETNRASAVQIVASGLGSAFNADSATRYWGLGGQILTSQVTEAFTPIKINKAGVLRNLAINVTANTRTTDTVYTVRKNGTTDTTLAVTVGAGQTGIVENNTNFEEIAADDTLTLKSVTGSGGGSITVPNTSVEYENALGYGFGLDLMTGGQSFTFNVLGYFTTHGQTVQNYTTEDQSIMTARDFMEYSRLTAFVTINTFDEDVVLRFRHRQADGNQVLTLPAGQTGFFTDTTNTDLVSPGDIVNLKLDTTAATTGQIKFGSFAILTDGSWLSLDVSQQNIHKYNVRTNTNQQSIQKYNILENVAADNSHKYNVRVNVSETSIHKYNLLQNIARTTIHKYNLLQNISKNIIHKYNLLHNVAGTTTHKWHNLINVTTESIHKWHDLMNVAAESIHKYDIITTTLVSAINIMKYHLFQNAALTNVHKYDIRQNIAAENTHKYNLISFIASQSIQKYHILQNIAASSIQKYHLLQLATALSIQKYHILQLAAQSSIQKYNIIQNAIAESIHKYHVRANIAAQSIHKWNISILMAALSIHKYDIFQLISAESIHKYHISDITLVAQTLIAKYHIMQNVTLESIHKWNVAQLIASQSIHKYNVYQFVSQTSGHVYTVLQNTALASIHKYHVLYNIALESTHRYNVAGLVSALSMHGYDILQYTSAVSTHLWNVLENVAASNVHKYSIRSLVASLNIHKYDITGVLGMVSARTIHLYNIAQNIATENIHKYYILNNVSEQLISKYHIYQNVAAETIHKWNSSAMVSTVSTHVYNMAGFISQTTTHVYNVLNAVSQITIQKYNILNLASLQSIHKYNIRQNIASLSQHIYNMSSHVSNESSHLYNILINAGQNSIHKYHVRQNISLTSQHIYNVFQNISVESRHLYDIIALVLYVSQTSIHKYHVRANVSATTRHIYNIGKHGLRSFIGIGTNIETKSIRKIFRDILKGDWPES